MITTLPINEPLPESLSADVFKPADNFSDLWRLEFTGAGYAFLRERGSRDTGQKRRTFYLGVKHYARKDQSNK